MPPASVSMLGSGLLQWFMAVTLSFLGHILGRPTGERDKGLEPIEDTLDAKGAETVMPGPPVNIEVTAFDQKIGDHVLSGLGVNLREIPWESSGGHFQRSELSMGEIEERGLRELLDMPYGVPIDGTFLIIGYDGLPLSLIYREEVGIAMFVDLIEYYHFNGQAKEHLRSAVSKIMAINGIKICYDMALSHYSVFCEFDENGGIRDIGTTAGRESPGADLMEIPVLPGVFISSSGMHPSSIISAKAAEKYVSQGEKVLIVGTGAGIEAMIAARKGAVVDAVDVRGMAVENTRLTCEIAGVGENVTAFANDLFAGLGSYDHIIFNMPHYAEEDKAGLYPRITGSPSDVMYTDLNGVLLRKFANQAKEHLNEGGTIVLINDRTERVKEILEEIAGSCDVRDFGYPDSQSRAYVITSGGFPDEGMSAVRADGPAAEDAAAAGGGTEGFFGTEDNVTANDIDKFGFMAAAFPPKPQFLKIFCPALFFFPEKR